MVKKIREATTAQSKADKKEAEEPGERRNQGKLLLDATCASADITYPTDIGILDRARQQTENIVDILYNIIKDIFKKKPRTYRNKARKDYLAIAKQRRAPQGKKRTAIKKQLQYLKRNLSHIEKLIELGAGLENLSKQQYKTLLVCQEVYRQQAEMYKTKLAQDSRSDRKFNPTSHPSHSQGKSRKNDRVWSQIISEQL